MANTVSCSVKVSRKKSRVCVVREVSLMTIKGLLEFGGGATHNFLWQKGNTKIFLLTVGNRRLLFKNS